MSKICPDIFNPKVTMASSIASVKEITKKFVISFIILGQKDTLSSLMLLCTILF